MVQVEWAAAWRSARRAAVPVLEQELIRAEQEEGEHWRSAGGRRILPAATPLKIEKSTALNMGGVPETGAGAQSPQAPPFLSPCNLRPRPFPSVRYEFRVGARIQLL
jgi:hypothetical protein